MSEKYHLTPVELELMEILWKIEQGTVRDVMAHLPSSRNLAYTSVSTILRILQQKHILTAEKMGRQHIYLPAYSKQTFATHSVRKMVEQIFSGNSVELVAHLINKKNLSTAEIADIRKLLNKKEKGTCLMLNTLISWHGYWVLNVAIASSYLIARLMLSLTFAKSTLSQWQRLKLARFLFILALATWSLLPLILFLIPVSYQNHFHLEPLLKNASNLFLKDHAAIQQQLKPINATPTSLPLSAIGMIFLSLGGGFLMIRYLKNIRTLRTLKQNAFCQHKIHKVHILFSQTAALPFCWSFIKNHFIAIPEPFLSRQNDLKLAIRHELQHIRQGDTYWLHFTALIKAFCFWNPFILLWMTWLDALQEFSCDEAVILRKKTAPTAYAQCLLDSALQLAPQATLGIRGLSQSILYRRINMLFTYQRHHTKKCSLLLAYAISLLIAASASYALTSAPAFTPLSRQQVARIIQQSHFDAGLQIAATPEVVNELNNIRSSDQARTFMRESLQRMKQYQPTIQAALQKDGMPTELLAIPLVESGYQPLEQNKNPVLAAGIWQIIPETARQLDLVVSPQQDDRLNLARATKAALTLLRKDHTQFKDWKLAVIAYEYGEAQTDQLIHTVGSRNAWVLARSPATLLNLKKFLATFDATVIILRNPSLIMD